MVARWDLTEYELLQRDARKQFHIVGDELDAPPAFGFDGSLEAADREAAMRAEACALDLYDLHDDGREPF